jgi:hypothetical protein
MRKAILGSVGALLTAAPLSLAAGPPAPPAFPPPALAVDLPPAPLPGSSLPAQVREAKTPEPTTPPPATGTLPAAPAPIPSPATNGCSSCGEPKDKWQDTHVGPREEIWLDAGYRIWWVKDARVTGPLVTPSTNPLFAGGEVGYGSFNGLTVDGGLWMDCRHTFGLEFGGFIFGREDVTASAASDAAGNPTIVRPFINGLTITPASAFVSTPAGAGSSGLAGAVSARTTSQLGGLNFNGVKNLTNCENYTVDYLMGFRYIDLEERLTVSQASTPLNGGTLLLAGATLPPGVGLSLIDDFHTRNQFYGGLVGTRGEIRFGPAFIDMTNTIAFGPNHETLDIYGTTSALTPGGGTVPGGLLAVGGGSGVVPGSANATSGGIPTFVHQGNIGRFTTNRFIIAPEVGVQAGAYVTSHIKLAVGYNFLYMSDVVRPGTQPDLQINTRFVPASPNFGTTSGQSVPMVTGNHEDFHAQGVTFSMEVKY